MAKQVFVSFSAVGATGGESDAVFLAAMTKRVNTALGAPKATTMLAGSAWRGAKATIGNGENSQNTADALAQGIKDSGGPASGYKASEVDSVGAISSLTDPAPV